MEAVQRNHLMIVKFLIEVGKADVNLQSKDVRLYFVLLGQKLTVNIFLERAIRVL